MHTYHELLDHILKEGAPKADRTGTGTRSIFGHQLHFNLQNGFPLMTTKKIHIKSVIHELLWFISGDTNVQYLQENGVRIWNEWADQDGNLGPVYGQQWRAWSTARGESIDQLGQAIEMIKDNPDSRRIIVNAWNVGDLPKMALAPCHCLFQFYVADGKLSCQLYQRSADVFLGVPFNIASYALLTHMVANVCGLEAGTFVHSFGDVHLYNNHEEQARTQLTRAPRSLPQLEIVRNVQTIEDFKYDDFVFHNYNPHPTIKAPVAV